MKSNRGLGRGLSALFSDTEEAYENAAKQPYVPDYKPQQSAPLPEDIKGLMEVDIDLVRPNPNQPRKNFDEDALNELELDDEDECCGCDDSSSCDDSCDCGEVCECGDSSECEEDKPADAQ